MGLSTTYTKLETDFLIQQLEKKTASGYKGDLNKTEAAPTEVGFYGLLETGVYTNLGGIDAQSGKLNFASFDGTTWSLIAIDIEIGLNQKIGDLKNNWQHPSYTTAVEMSDFIEVIEGDYFEPINNSNFFRVKSYDKNKTEINTTLNPDITQDSVLVPKDENLKYLRFTRLTGDTTEIVLKNSTTRDFELLKRTKPTKKILRRRLVNFNGNKLLTSTGETAKNDWKSYYYQLSNLEKTLGQKYSISWEAYGSSVFMIGFFDESGTLLGTDGAVTASPSTLTDYEFTPPTNTHWIRFYSNVAQIPTFGQVIEQVNDIIEIDCFGDSLTAGAKTDFKPYPDKLECYIGSDDDIENIYQVNNLGIGGENSWCIAARQGGIPMKLVSDTFLPSDLTAAQIQLKSVDAYYTENLALLLQGDNVNPVTIRGIKGNLSYSSGNYYFTRLVAGYNAIAKAGELVISDNYKKSKNIQVIFVGQNDTFDNANPDYWMKLVARIKRMTDFVQGGRFIVVSSHKRTNDAFEQMLYDEFGNKYFNLRFYLSRNGLADAGLTPTAEDTTAMNDGLCPPSLMASDELPDQTHLNSIGADLLAKQIWLKLKENGLID